MLIPSFNFRTNLKEVSFTDTSLGSVDATWDFGDSQVDNGKEVTHEYAEFGFYLVTLTVTNAAGDTESLALPIGLSGQPYETPHLALIPAFYQRLPESLKDAVQPIHLNSTILKWQNYIFPHVVPSLHRDLAHLELHWPTLYNELVLELVIIDIFDNQIRQYLLGIMTELGQAGSGGSSGSSQSGGGLKKVVTGPAEAEWYDVTSAQFQSASSNFTAISRPGGLIDQAKATACALAGYLRIPLEICQRLSKPILPFKIAKHVTPK